MRDIPLFTATDGIATLILHEIPFRQEGYVWIRTVYGRLEGLMKECAGFCRAAGAQKVYFSGEGDFRDFPVYARLIYRSVEKSTLLDGDAVVLPGLDATALPGAEAASIPNEEAAPIANVEAAPLSNTEAVALPTRDPESWLSHYRSRFRQVPAAGSIPSAEGRYDIFQDHTLIGIGQVQGGMIQSIAALLPGKGADCVKALAPLCEGPKVTLVCAEENLPAMKLYDRLGFSRENVKEVWYSLK
ncbi:MAG: hypothetical protein IKM59_01945 [Oscillospiraceae bacterium]|nr:hypothetical protein [Oscillospiraceae bacterium]